MPSKPIEFKTTDAVTLRGDLFTPSTHNGNLPILILQHGWSCVKEMELPRIATHLTSTLPMAVLIYDHRGFGASDTRPGSPIREIVPSEQISDLSDAVTFASTQLEAEGIDGMRVGVWGYSFGGGHAIAAGAADVRVRAVIAAAPVVSGMGQFQRVIPPASREVVWQAFGADRAARLTGAEPTRMPVITSEPGAPASMGSRDSYNFFSKWDGKCSWVNDMTLRTSYLVPYTEPSGMIQYISPRPLLMFVAERDFEAPAELALEAFAKAREPKRIEVFSGVGHFGIFDGVAFERMMEVTVEFLKERLLS